MKYVYRFFVRFYMACLDPIIGLLWYSDDYRGFLHWLSIWSYEEYFRCEGLLEKSGCIPIVVPSVRNPNIKYTYFRVPKYF